MLRRNSTLVFNNNWVLEGQNKVMMYGMNAMFVVLFNGFPAALNLYYVVYNLLNYLQQRKKDDGSSFFSKLKTFFQNQKNESI